MQPTELTPNGVERLLDGETAIIQIIESKRVVKQSNGKEIPFMVASLSDGYCYLENVYINYESVDESKLENSVVKISLYEVTLKKFKKNPKDGAMMIADPTTYLPIFHNINQKIGCPMAYGEYLKNEKLNLKGSNIIFGKKEDEEIDEEEDYFEQAQRLNQTRKVKQNFENSKEKSLKNLVLKPSNSNRISSIGNKNETENKRDQSRECNPSKRVEEGYKKAPVQKEMVKIEEKRVTSKSEENSNDSFFGNSDKIRDLYLNMESFKLVARLLFIWPIKPYTNKKGIQSELLNMEFGDETGTIMCTVFGENSNRYCNLMEDNIYSIEGAMVSEANYKGVTEKKLTFGDGTKVSVIKGSNIRIPSLEKFCISLRELNECEKGRIVTVKCLIKQGDFTEFVSKAGNKIKKKTLKMFDIENQIECDLTLMNDKAEIEYIEGMYALKGVEVDEFNGKKQFKGSLIFLAKYLKNHPMNKRIKEIDEITFTCITSNVNQSNKQCINSFSVLNQKSENLNLGENLWSEVVCYLKAVRIGGNSQNYYLGCPFCKKKITNESATDCPHCRRDIERPKHRYLLSLNLIDDQDSIWANAYDEGEKILALPNEDVFTADSFAECNEESLKQRAHSIRYKRMKLKIVSGKEEYNNESRIKHKVVKVLPISYCEESKYLLENIKSVISSL